MKYFVQVQQRILTLRPILASILRCLSVIAITVLTESIQQDGASKSLGMNVAVNEFVIVVKWKSDVAIGAE